MITPRPGLGLGLKTFGPYVTGGLGIVVSDLVTWVDFDHSSGVVGVLDRDSDVVSQITAMTSAEVMDLQVTIEQLIDTGGSSRLIAELTSKLNAILERETDSANLMDRKTTREQ